MPGAPPPGAPPPGVPPPGVPPPLPPEIVGGTRRIVKVAVGAVPPGLLTVETVNMTVCVEAAGGLALTMIVPLCGAVGGLFWFGWPRGFKRTEPEGIAGDGCPAEA